MGTPHDRRTLCLSSALADRYEGHETLESMPSPQNMHDGGRLSIHGRRHASALCALQRRAVAQIAPHIELRCRPLSLEVCRPVWVALRAVQERRKWVRGARGFVLFVPLAYGTYVHAAVIISYVR